MVTYELIEHQLTVTTDQPLRVCAGSTVVHLTEGFVVENVGDIDQTKDGVTCNPMVEKPFIVHVTAAVWVLIDTGDEAFRDTLRISAS